MLRRVGRILHSAAGARARRPTLAAALVATWLAGATATAQEDAVEARESLELTMRLLPEGVRDPEAIIKTIELPLPAAERPAAAADERRGRQAGRSEDSRGDERRNEAADADRERAGERDDDLRDERGTDEDARERGRDAGQDIAEQARDNRDDADRANRDRGDEDRGNPDRDNKD
jgi:hypothetical protein